MKSAGAAPSAAVQSGDIEDREAFSSKHDVYIDEHACYRFVVHL